MCKNIVFLSLLFVIKIVFVVLIPIFIAYMIRSKKENNIKNIFIVDVCVLLLFILLLIFKNSCVINSTISGIKKIYIINNAVKEEYYEQNDYSMVERIITDKIYKNNINNNVYYFNHNELPLSDKKIKCDDEYVYLKNYGNNLTAFSIGISTILDKNVDPIELLKKGIDNNLFVCGEGFNTNNLISLIRNTYNLEIFDLNSSILNEYIRNGGIVIEEINDDATNNNISCGAGYIVIYSVTKDGKYSILNPNDKNYDYICPENTSNFGKVISANTNDKLYSENELKSIATRFIAIERK